MPLVDYFDRPLRLQAYLRGAFIPLCVVCLATSADIKLAVQATQVGAITVLPQDHSFEDLSQSLLTAANCQRTRAAWISETRNARQLLLMLSDRQRDVMFRVFVGVTNKAIGLQLDISVKTVEKHRQEVHLRTKTSTLPDLVSTRL
jgi:two-component system response regulator FixJ